MEQVESASLRGMVESSDAEVLSSRGTEGSTLLISCLGGRDVRIVLERGDGSAVHTWESHGGGRLSSAAHIVGPDDTAQAARELAVEAYRGERSIITFSLAGGVLERFDPGARLDPGESMDGVDDISCGLA